MTRQEQLTMILDSLCRGSSCHAFVAWPEDMCGGDERTWHLEVNIADYVKVRCAGCYIQRAWRYKEVLAAKANIKMELSLVRKSLPLKRGMAVWSSVDELQHKGGDVVDFWPKYCGTDNKLWAEEESGLCGNGEGDPTEGRWRMISPDPRRRARYGEQRPWTRQSLG